MPSIIAYAYDTDIHCVPCTKRRFPFMTSGPDEHGVPISAVDTERNPVTPVFSTDELTQDIHCHQCRDIIARVHAG